MSTAKKKKSSPLPAIVVVVALGALGWAGFRDGGWFDGGQQNAEHDGDYDQCGKRVDIGSHAEFDL